MVAGCSPARRARTLGLSGPLVSRTSRMSRSTSLSATCEPDAVVEQRELDPQLAQGVADLGGRPLAVADLFSAFRWYGSHVIRFS